MNTDHYNDLLTAEKLRIEGDLQAVARRNPHNPGDWEGVPEDTGQQADMVDQAAEIEAYAENVAVTHELEMRLAQVVEALARIQEGTYGTCTVCGKPIEEARLGADPAALTCIEHR